MTQQGPPALPQPPELNCLVLVPLLTCSIVALLMEMPQKSFLTWNIHPQWSSLPKHPFVPFSDQATAFCHECMGFLALTSGWTSLPTWDPKASPLAHIPAWNLPLHPSGLKHVNKFISPVHHYTMSTCQPGALAPSQLVWDPNICGYSLACSTPLGP